MANKIKVKLNMPGLNELMKGPEMQSHLQNAADAVARFAGADYGTRVHVASFVAIANVFPNSKEAAIENSSGNVLLKSLSGVGLSLHK